MNADAAHGYVASESTTGTRVASRIQDLPFAVNVVTADFVNDLGLFNLADQLANVSGFSPSEVTGQYQLRGFPGQVTLVDGFRRLGLVDTVDVARFEIIKGTNGSIYGAVPPGGVLNYITRQPTTTPTGQVTFGGGTDSFLRATAFASGPLGNSGKVFYELNGAEMFNRYMQQFASKHNQFVSGKLLFKPDDKTDLQLSVEHTEIYEHPFVQLLTITEKRVMPWVGNSVTESQYFGDVYGTDLLNYNYAGPESYNHQRMTSATLSAERQFSEFYNLKVGVNAFANPFNNQTVGSGAYYPYGTGNVTLAGDTVQQPFAPVVKDQPQASWNPQKGGGAQIDNLFTFATGPVKNQLLVTGDYYELSQRQFSLAAVSGTGQATDYYALYSPRDPSGAPYYARASTWNPALGYGWNTTLYGQNPSLYTDVTNDQWTAFGDYGVFVNENASLLDGRLHLMAGGRFDDVHNQVRNYVQAGPGGAVYTIGGPEPVPYQHFDYNVSGWTHQLGATFEVVRGLNVYLSDSSGFNPQPQIDSSTGLPLQNNTSTGREAGFKGALEGGRLTWTADWYRIDEKNLAQTETDPVTGVKNTILAGLERSQGYEFDGSYAVTNQFLIQANWGYNQARILDSAPITFLQQLPIRRVPRNNLGATLRYAFTGRLHGLYTYLNGYYYSKSLINLGSGKSLIPGPAGSSVGSAGTLYYVPSQNLTYAVTDPKQPGEIKISTVPFINVPLPGSGLLPFPAQPANATLAFPVDLQGNPLPVKSTNVYTGEAQGVYVDDGRQLIFNPSYTVFRVGAGYSWKTGLYTHKVQVNVNNLFNRAYTYGSGTPGAPFQIYTQYTLGF